LRMWKNLVHTQSNSDTIARWSSITFFWYTLYIWPVCLASKSVLTIWRKYESDCWWSRPLTSTQELKVFCYAPAVRLICHVSPYIYIVNGFITHCTSIADFIRNANFGKTVRYIILFHAVTYVEILHTVLYWKFISIYQK
jgi:hypothetical protein